MTSKQSSGAGFATMEALRQNTVPQLFKTHLNRGIDKTASTKLRDNLADYHTSLPNKITISSTSTNTQYIVAHID